jgi:paraquat-inducible protein B
MSKQANKTVVGGFVVGAIVIIIAGILIFGSGKFFEQKRQYVLFFEGSVKGLQIGAPVTFRGVRIGSVTDIKVYVSGRDAEFRVPVFIETEPDRLTLSGETRRFWDRAPRGKLMQDLIKRGLRAQLGLQSFLTGQLYVALDFFPDSPIKLVGAEKGYSEIPTVITPMQEVAKVLKEVPLKELAQKLMSTADGVEKLVNAPEIMESIKTLDAFLKDSQALVKNLDGRVTQLATSADETLRDAQKLVRDVDAQVDPLASGLKGTMRDARKLLRNVDDQVAPIRTEMMKTAQLADDSLDQLKKTLAAIEALAASDSPMIYELTKMLQDLSKAAQSIRALADYLERHPEALISGKGGPGGR